MTPVQKALLRTFKTSNPALDLLDYGWRRVTVHACNHKGSRFRQQTFQKLEEKGLIQSIPPGDTWWEITEEGKALLKKL